MTDEKTLRRNSDPFTSHEAANKVNVAKMERIVCEAIDSFGKAGCISDQVLHVLEQDGYGYGSVTPRYSNLKRKGKVIVDGRTVRAKSGRNQLIMWGAKFYQTLEGKE